MRMGTLSSSDKTQDTDTLGPQLASYTIDRVEEDWKRKYLEVPSVYLRGVLIEAYFLTRGLNMNNS